jgi:glutathione peroxidase
MKTLLLMLTIMIQSAPASLHDFKANAIDGKQVDFSSFKGKKVLIVNTASRCGYTPQYAQLEELAKTYAGKLVVIGFPANDFGAQEPGTNAEIAGFCSKNYGVTFQMMEKVTVKGGQQHPLFRWLTSQENPDFTGDINWNFEKFLLDENGKLLHRYRSKVNPMGEEIRSALVN